MSQVIQHPKNPDPLISAKEPQYACSESNDIEIRKHYHRWCRAESEMYAAINQLDELEDAVKILLAKSKDGPSREDERAKDCRKLLVKRLDLPRLRARVRKLEKLVCDLEERISRTPASSAEGVLLKLKVADEFERWSDLDYKTPDGSPSSANFVVSAMTDLERMCSETLIGDRIVA